MSAQLTLGIEADAAARAWLEAHPAAGARVIAYDVTRCCGGGRLCSVSVRERSRGDDLEGHAKAALEDGSILFVDRRAAARLPSRFQLTVRGIGPFKHLDLELSGEQWARLLYD
jgi:hypothetical protein